MLALRAAFLRSWGKSTSGLSFTYFGDKVHGGIAKGFQHWCGFCIEEGHSIGHLIIDFILNV